MAAGLALGACSRAVDTSDLDQALRPPSTAARSLWPKLVAAVDARLLSAELRSAALHAEPDVRAQATALLGRLEIDAARPLLELALADIDPGIRLDAARGIARHPDFGKAEREQLLLAAYLAEPSPSSTRPGVDAIDARLELLELLADVWPNASSPVLTQPVPTTSTFELAARCRALGRLAQRGHVPPEAALDLLLDGLTVMPPAQAADCAAALAQPVLKGRIPSRPELAARLLELGSTAPTEVVAAFLDALAQLGGPESLPGLEALLGDRSPERAVAAARAFVRLAPLPRLLAVTNQRLEQSSAPESPTLSGANLHVLLILFGALESHVQQPEVAELAERAVIRLSTTKESPRAALSRGLAECAAARLADLTRSWPKHSLSCSTGIAPDSVRDTGIADVMGRATGSDELRATHLERVLRKGARAAQLEAIRATAGLPVALAVPLLLEAMTSTDPALSAAAFRALTPRAPDLRGRADVVSALATSSARAVEAPEAALAFIHAAQAFVRPSASSPLDPALRSALLNLAEHPALGIRTPARALLEEWQQAVPAGHRPVETPLDASQVPARDALFHVKLWTSAGSALELRLFPAQAPAAVARFVELVETGALNDLPVASLTPGRLIAFRPSAPVSFALRHEDATAPVRGGSVVLQDHGRDASGPGFALVLARMPELDRRVTVLGTLQSPLEEALALHAGDRIERAELITDR